MKVYDTTNGASTSQYTECMKKLLELITRPFRSEKINPDKEWLATLPVNRLPFQCYTEVYKKEKVTEYRKNIMNALSVNDAFMVEHIDNLIEWLFCHVQSLPASLNDHHRDEDGLLLHSLDVALIALKKVQTDASYHPRPPPKDHERRQTLQDCRVYLFLLSICHDLYKVSNEMEIFIHIPGNEPIKFDPHPHGDFTNNLYLEFISHFRSNNDLKHEDISRCYYSYRHLSYRENKYHKDGLIPFVKKALADVKFKALAKNIKDRHLSWESDFLTEVTFPIIEKADFLSCQRDVSKTPITTEDIRNEHLYILVYWAKNQLLDRLVESTGKYFLRRHLLTNLLSELPDMKAWLNAKTYDPEHFVRLLKVEKLVEHASDPENPSKFHPIWQMDGVHQGVYLLPNLTHQLLGMALRSSQAQNEDATNETLEPTASETPKQSNDTPSPDSNSHDQDQELGEQNPDAETQSTTAHKASSKTTPTDISALGVSVSAPPVEKNDIENDLTTLELDSDKDATLSGEPSSPSSSKDTNQASTKKRKKPGKKQPDKQKEAPTNSAPPAFALLESLFLTDIDHIARTHGTFTESGSLKINRKYLMSYLGEMKYSSAENLVSLQAYCSEHFSHYWTLSGTTKTNLELSEDYLSSIGYGGEPQNALIAHINQTSNLTKRSSPTPSDETPSFSTQEFESFLLKELDVIPEQENSDLVELPMSLFEAYVVDKALKGQAINALKKSGLLVKHNKQAVFLNPKHLESPRWPHS